MSIDKDAEFYKLLVGIIAFFAGLLNLVIVAIVKYLYNNDKELYDKYNAVEHRVTVVETAHKMNHEDKERNKK